MKQPSIKRWSDSKEAVAIVAATALPRDAYLALRRAGYACTRASVSSFIYKRLRKRLADQV